MASELPAAISMARAIPNLCVKQDCASCNTELIGQQSVMQWVNCLGEVSGVLTI